jgi:NitT/TauT family transport system ATP-binding protein
MKKIAKEWQPLPHAPIAMVFGLLEHLREASGGREDLYKLGGPLGLELDDLLPVTEAAKQLGLVKIASGDIELTGEGRALAETEAPERKERLRRRLFELPLLRRIRETLQAAEGGRVRKREFLELLEDHFSPVEAERQLGTALDWARYGELFDFDPDTEEFVLAS